MTQFAEKDSKSLRRSGTEDEYEEQDQLLQELLDLAKEYNYKYRRIRKISDKHSSDGGAARLTKSAAGHSRDAAAAAYAATVNNNATNSDAGTDNVTPSLLFDLMVTGSSDTETVPVEEQQPVPMPAPRC
ncbi:hypothetical protein MTO96_051795 [Rhipicephalus appendiculatus]